MLKILLKCVREFKKHSILAPLYVSMEVVMEVIIPLLMANLIDNGINKGDTNYIMVLGIALVISCLISLAFGALSGRSAAIASAGFAKNLRRDMFCNVQDFSFENIDRFSNASLITRLTTDVTNLQNAYQMIIRVAVRSPIMLIFSMIMAFAVNKNLALVFLCVVPVLAVGLYFIMTKAHPIFKKVFKTYDKLNLIVQENIRGIRVVKSFVREDYEVEKFNKISDEIYSDFSRAERLLAFNSPLMQFCMYSCTLLISWLGAKLIVGGTMSEGELVSIITYASQILMSLMMVSMIIVMITISKASAERICEVLEEKSTLANCENPIFDIENGDIEFKNVNFGYSKNKFCLKNINVKINSGETVGIIGGTGSSKSSFVQLIPRLYDVLEGEVLVSGKDVREYDIKTLRDSVSMVLQKNVLFSGTIKENLRWGCENATDEQIKEAAKAAQAHGFIESFPDKYDTFIEQGGANVSGGQKQRLCIARALLKKPKILILDDSTSAVDTKTDSLIQKAFKEQIPDTTKIIIAQRISSVQHADKIIVLNGGVIDAVGTHTELLENNDIYRQVYTSQNKGGEENA